jgi:hypothetical protein
MDSWTKCGFIHDGVCPQIKSIEYYENGMIKKVEYHNPNESANYDAMPQYDDEENAAMPF